MYTPFPFYKTFTYKNKLQKLTKYKLRYHYSPTPAYANLKAKYISLPFVHPLDFNDLQILLEHEEKHFEVTKKPAIIYDTTKYAEIVRASNILEDIIINKDLPAKKLETAIKKLGGKPELTITLWHHKTEEERKKIIEKMKKAKILKEEYSVEEIYKIFEETIEERQKYDDLQSFSKTSMFKKFVDIFEEPGIIEPGDGPAEFSKKYNLPDWNLVKKFRNILKNLRAVTTETYYYKKFYGKRINRSFFENPAEIYPFQHSKTVTSINMPSVTVVLDCSGSMEYEPEIMAKSFIVALMQVNNNTLVVLHNEYFTIKTKATETVIKTPSTGDEHFDKLEHIDKSDILIVISDINISEKEAKGLEKLAGRAKARRKYLLCVDPAYLDNYPELNKYYKRVDIGDKEKFIQFAKKLVS